MQGIRVSNILCTGCSAHPRDAHIPWHVTRGWQLCTGNTPGVGAGGGVSLGGKNASCQGFTEGCHITPKDLLLLMANTPIPWENAGFPHWKATGQKQYPDTEQVLGRGNIPSLDVPPATSPTPTAGASQGRSRSWPRRWPAGRSSRRHRSHPTCCCTPCGRRRRGASRRNSGRAFGSRRHRSR